MKKKTLIVLSFLFITALGAAATSCSCSHHGDSSGSPSTSGSDSTGGDSSSAPEPVKYYSVDFQESEGVKFFCDGHLDSVKEGETVSFTVTVGAFYTGEPIVKANGTALEAKSSDDGTSYTVTVTENITITAEGVSKAASQLDTTGTGTADDPFEIAEPIDLLYMAERVNAGYETYVCGYYTLKNSLDLKGEELEIIGNGSTEHSFFAGYFNGNGNTISNFVIDSSEYDYVGLFGIVQANLGEVDGAGGTIYGLNLANYTITAKSTGATLVCGSLVAAGFGANLYLCNAENGTIDLYGDQNNFSYAGGLIGIQQSFNASDYGSGQYFSEVAYCSVDVDINCNMGITFVAGGITGYLVSADATTVATVINSYSTGNITGALYTGGVVGWLGTYTAVMNCYSTGLVNAQTEITDTTNSLQYCYAYAGGIAAMAQNDSVIVDCFATGELSAVAQLGKNYTVIGETLATKEEIQQTSFGSRLACVYNCYYAKNGQSGSVNLKDSAFIRENLCWNTVDWVFEDGKYPVVNTEETTETTYTVTLDFGNIAVAGEGGEDIYNLEIELPEFYKSMTFWYQYGAIVERVMAKNGYTSYGYFFDSEHTMPVPYGYVPTRDITLYAAFADYKDIVGVYYIRTADPTISVKLELDETGAFQCTDPSGTVEGSFLYDGEFIVFYGARFARYYGNTTTLQQQQAYNFRAELTSEGNLSVVGGLYTDSETSESYLLIPFTSPLIAVKGAELLTGSYYSKKESATTVYTFYTNGTGELVKNGETSSFTYTLQGRTLTLKMASATLTGTVANGVITLEGSVLSVADRYAGTWEMDSTSKKYYTFDGAGNWKYDYYGYRYDNASSTSFLTVLDETKGTYTLNEDGAAVLSDGTIVKFGEDGLLTVTSAKGNEFTYGKMSSYFGVWTTLDKRTELTLYGIDENGAGVAKIVYTVNINGSSRKETYVLDYYIDVLTRGMICLYYEDAIYGILSYNTTAGVLTGNLYSVNSESYEFNTALYRVDEYKGEWISDDPLFEIVDFNGYGSYNISYSGGRFALEGKLVIDGETVSYILEDSTLEGYFYYKGEIYSIVFDESSGTVSVSYGENASTLVRKDAFAGLTLVGEDGNVYTFDGRGNLTAGGVMTETQTGGKVTEYTYRITEDGATVFEKNTATPVGSISIVENTEKRSFYQLTLNETRATLGIQTAFTGNWSVSAVYGNLLEIGLMDTEGTIQGRIPLESNGVLQSVETTFTLVDDEYLYCIVEDSLFYVIQVSEKEFVISSYLNWFDHEGYYGYATVTDELFGSWTDITNRVFHFDGVGYCDGVYGMAYSSIGESTTTTNYYYRWFAEQECYVIINSGNGTAQKVNFCAVGTRNSYKNEAGDKAFTLTPVNLEDYVS